MSTKGGSGDEYSLTRWIFYIVINMSEYNLANYTK
jgi:hypothetical protein